MFLFSTLLGKPPRTMNRDHEGICITRNNKIDHESISGSPEPEITKLDQESVSSSPEQQKLGHESISGSPETTQRHYSGYSHRPASADAPLNHKRGGTAAWQRGISTSWVPRHTHGHFPSHRSLEKQSLQAARKFDIRIALSHDNWLTSSEACL